MRFSLSALVRMIVFTAIGLNIVAIGLGRMFPEGPNGRRLRPIHEVQVNSFAWSLTARSAQFLDAESGQLHRFTPPPGERLEHARCSPWVDDRRQSQVVGQWSAGALGLGGEAPAVGLARFTFPDGEPLDRIETGVYPASPPCWFPGTGARVLFAAGDGKLYRFDFEDGPTPPGAPKPARQPTRLAWGAAGLPGEEVFVSDPCWPGDRGLENYVFASVRVQKRGSGRVAATALWWLELNADRTRVVAAGPLGGGAEASPIRRFPAVARTSDTDFVLAHLHRGPGERTWRLDVAPLRVDAATGRPALAWDRSRTVAEACVASPPAFSSGGRWVSCILPGEGDLPRGVRLPVADPRVAQAPEGESSDSRRHDATPPPSSDATGGSSHRFFGATRST